MPATANSAIPRLWDHVAALGYARSHRSILTLRNAAPTDFIGQGRLSARTIRDRFDADLPSLADQNTSHLVVRLLNFHFSRNKQPELNAANEVVLFRFCLPAPASLSNPKLTEHGTELEAIADTAGCPVEVVQAAFSGRLLPRETCNAIALAANLNPADAVSVGRGRQAPIKDARLISAVLEAIRK